ncbi:hypothetical protein [Bacillus sp. AK031]
MTKLKTLSKQIPFRYDGSVTKGTTIYFGNNRRLNVSSKDWLRLLDNFEGSVVPLGTSRTNPPKGSLGEWLISNVTKVAIASYIGPILISEGYATLEGKSDLKIIESM